VADNTHLLAEVVSAVYEGAGMVAASNEHGTDGTGRGR